MEPFFLRKILVLHKMGKKSTLLNFSPYLFIRFFWNCTKWQAWKSRSKRVFRISKENFCFVQNGRIGSILGPKSTRFNISLKMFVRFFWSYIWWLSIPSLNANATKWSNTFKQFTGFCRRIVGVCLTILWSWCVKG